MSVNPKPAVCLLAASLLLGLSACSNEIEAAMSDGCEALPAMSDAYAAGDRAAFDAAAEEAQDVGFASFRGPDLTNDETLISDADAAHLAYSTLYDAAYEPPEANNGASVWRGRKLTAPQQRDIAAGLAACERY